MVTYLLVVPTPSLDPNPKLGNEATEAYGMSLINNFGLVDQVD
jgi:hypothetical protein